MQSDKSVLFVDDEEEILEILVELFSDNAYHLYTATHAQQALDIIDCHKINFVISDLKLPDQSGIELLETVRMRQPDAVRVLTSGFLNVKFGEVTQNEKDGTLYISKPWDFKSLKELICCKLDN
jgi:DNA-binding NtrC family response regulator